MLVPLDKMGSPRFSEITGFKQKFAIFSCKFRHRHKKKQDTTRFITKHVARYFTGRKDFFLNSPEAKKESSANFET